MGIDMELTDTHFILYPIAFECLLHFLFYSCVSSSFIVQDAFIIHDLCHVIVDCCFFFVGFIYLGCLSEKNRALSYDVVVLRLRNFFFGH